MAELMDGFFFDPFQHNAPLILAVVPVTEARERDNGAAPTKSGLPEDKIQVLGKEVGSGYTQAFKGVAAAIRFYQFEQSARVILASAGAPSRRRQRYRGDNRGDDAEMINDYPGDKIERFNIDGSKRYYLNIASTNMITLRHPLPLF
jgi:hypothetical protein